MTTRWVKHAMPLALCLFFSTRLPAAGESQNPAAGREQAQKAEREGNYKNAFDLYRQLCSDPAGEPQTAADDMAAASGCLRQLNRTSEFDAFVERIVSIHSQHWPVLQRAALLYREAPHEGAMIADAFQRGIHRGEAKYVNANDRDRVRTLQLMNQAVALVSASQTTPEQAAQFYLAFADLFEAGRGYGTAWRLQYITDLGALPDYDEGYNYGQSGRATFAPTDAQGQPVFHSLPARYEAAASDGERWRWLLRKAQDSDSNITAEVLMRQAEFLQSQFDVHTMDDNNGMGRLDEESDSAATNTFQIHQLTDDETMARLATGIKRFELPAEFNFIRLFQQVVDLNTGRKEAALRALADTYENRRQYDKAAAIMERMIAECGEETWKRERLEQITGNWGRFEPVMTRPAGAEAQVEYRFRNGRKVHFMAQRLDVSTLLKDVKSYLLSNPGQIEWDQINIGNIGYMIVEQDKARYLGETAAEWDMDLEPRPSHFDRRITVKTPLIKAGAYLLTAVMKDGNTSKVIVWLDDTALVKKPMSTGQYCFVADAVSGQPLNGMNVEFFGYDIRNTSSSGGGRQYEVFTTNLIVQSDTDGQAIFQKEAISAEHNYQWMITATSPEGRLAFLGFTGIWLATYYEQEYNELKVYGITDRPVYRPDQTVKFKFWIRQAAYDQQGPSPSAGENFAVILVNPKGDKIMEKTYTSDGQVGFDGDYAIPKDAMLGEYYAYIWKGHSMGGVRFRVEEYKKPEFEVRVDVPTEPKQLGEMIQATVKANYYFGAPVTRAKLKYKVMRYEHDSRWYPFGPWDWLYEPGYGWFGYDYTWYPGWRKWGCVRPHSWWWPKPYNPPELVAESDAEMGPDGAAIISIDTAPAKEAHGDVDHRYEITAEVTDESRRTIVGKGEVLVARRPFTVYTWVDRGHYKVGDTIRAEFSARTVDGKAVQGQGEMSLLKIAYTDEKPVETTVGTWTLTPDADGKAGQQIPASEPGQYRLACKVTDTKGHTIEGGNIFCITGEGFDGRVFRFDQLELVPDKKDYSPGDKVRLLINTEKTGSTVVLFVRPANGVCLPPKVIRIAGKSWIEEIDVTLKDMPNFFVEAFTVSDGALHSEMRELVVPPEKRVINVEVLPSSHRYKPGAQANIRLRLTDFLGKPIVGSMAMSVYDKAVEYISGGSNVQSIRDFFWKWRRHHSPTTESSLDRQFFNIVLPKTIAMRDVGVFGQQDELTDENGRATAGREVLGSAMTDRRSGVATAMMSSAPMAATGEEAAPPGASSAEPQTVQPFIRTEFADTAFWAGALTADSNGIAEAEFKMPENLTAWKIRTWAMGDGTAVGEGTAEITTAKDVLVRLQAPRFFIEKDEVVLSANIHNYLDAEKQVKAVLELNGGALEAMSDRFLTVMIPAGGEQRVDWRVKVVREGEAVVRMSALTDVESDAMEMKFPVYVHGMMKTESFCGVIRPDREGGEIKLRIPDERRPDQSRLELRYSPTLAAAMVDALPYLVDYPYGCTEQTLNRFLPTVITHKILKDSGIDLAAVRDKQSNGNAQETGNDLDRAAQWKRYTREPVFDPAVVKDMVASGVKTLADMQCADGGWGWFSGLGEYSSPHTTASVVHGLQMARKCGATLPAGMLERGIKWLDAYQAAEIKKLRNADKKNEPYKTSADPMDAFVLMVLVDEGKDSYRMREFLYRDRNNLPVYAKTMLGLIFNKLKRPEELKMMLENIEQYLVMDEENQTACLNLGNTDYWWCWYGSEFEAHAYYLKLLAATDSRSDKASWLVKYLLNNRKHATYWTSTRDTALCIEAMADYLTASGEDAPDMTLELLFDGVKQKDVTINKDNLFTFDNKLVIEGEALKSGEHTLALQRKGTGPVYYNAYLSNFTLEDPILKAGLEVKVQRAYYKLTPVDKQIQVAGSRGQPLGQKVETYARTPLKDGAQLTSGDLVEIELVLDSKNDYEYILVEDMKSSGFEPVDVRSGYNGNEMGAYVEYRDERVCLFIRSLARGQHSVSYRMRAEIPGKFSVLPTRVSAMYAPELKANSDEFKLKIDN